MKKSILSLGAAVLLLAGCNVSANNDGVMQAETRKSGFMGMSTNDSVEVSKPKAFAGVNQVVIGGFKVGFNESKRMQNKARGSFLSSATGGKSTGLAKLEGISPATMQSITDQAYNDFVQELKSQGYTVVARSEFVNSAHYDGIKEYQFPYLDDNSGMLSSYGAGTYYSPSAIGSNQPIFMGEIPGMTGGFGFSNPASAAAEFGKETGIPVINVTYFIDFAGYGGHESMMSSSLKVGQLLSVDAGTLGIISDWGGTFSDGVGSLTLGQPIGSSKEFATIENTTSDVNAAGQYAANAVSALLGGGTNKTREFVYHANPSQYKAASTEVLAQANDMFVGQMASLR